ncbi:MAG: ATP-binding cassette domain-containing protein [Deltaproteobacteria bacterium]|jgi:putative ATP-binding cassette transporter|nr:ATP-binding cassette domain-containing protein [Deltaproteobacteria bacterium]
MMQVDFLMYLIEKTGPERRKLIIGSLGAGALQGFLLYSISRAVEELSDRGTLTLATIALFALAMLGLYKWLDQAMNISAKAGREIVTGLELRIAQNLSRIDYSSFVSLDQARIYEALSGTKDIVNEAAILLPIFISSCAMLLCSFIFSAFISLAGLGAVLAVMGLAGLFFARSDRRFVGALFEYRREVEEFQKALKDVVHGFVELKMNERRRRALFEKVIDPRHLKVVGGRRKADGFRVQNTVMYGLMAYAPVAALLFILPLTGLATLTECVKIAVITMFSTMPLIGLLSFLPLASRAAFIVKGLDDFEAELASCRDEGAESQKPAGDFRRLTIAKGLFSYPGPNGGSKGFTLKIEDFHLDRGELVILRGGNGSGKSTFMRLLAGLTSLDEGEALVDGLSASEMGASNYRAFFSTVFPDFHLFPGAYGLDASAERIREELARMALDKKIDVSDEGGFSSLNLSSGQRKRLALACAILEERPILLFDEVAAEFDRHFRELFYRDMLPRLKASGRTIVAVSHDERYFDVADRVLTLQYGEFA